MFCLTDCPRTTFQLLRLPPSFLVSFLLDIIGSFYGSTSRFKSLCLSGTSIVARSQLTMIYYSTFRLVNDSMTHDPIKKYVSIVQQFNDARSANKHKRNPENNI